MAIDLDDDARAAIAAEQTHVIGAIVAKGGSSPKAVPPERLHWDVTLFEPGHSHFVLQNQPGPGGTFVPFPTDEPVAETFYRLTLRAQDATGLQGVRSMDVLPDSVQPGTTDAAPAPAAPLRLLGATPNPFNPSTHIRFELAAAAHVSLEIEDVRGRRVRTLWDGDLPPGPHAAHWDGRSRTGVLAPSGVYLARLHSGSSTVACRLVLLR